MTRSPRARVLLVMGEVAVASCAADRAVGTTEVDLPSAVRELARDDPAALEEVYDLLADRIYGVALWVTGNEEEASEAVQDTLLRVWRKRRRVARARDPVGYVLRMARSVAIDRLRRNRHRPAGSTEGLLEPVDDEPERRLDAERVSRLLSRLPVAQRAVCQS